ncbi:MAG: 50S ribosomal protein L32 [Anaerolineales bacterium]|nr:MAG: 50S ribosomal protein L32 [Anaerolineales bacterium]
MFSLQLPCISLMSTRSRIYKQAVSIPRIWSTCSNKSAPAARASACPYCGYYREEGFQR